jgi:hypothetical protein
MSKAPSPKAEQIRAMREANFAARRPEKVYAKAVGVLTKAAAKRMKTKGKMK